MYSSKVKESYSVQFCRNLLQKHVKRIALLLFKIVFCLAIVNGHEIEVINSNHGLSSDEVRFIHQDSKGFLWFLTKNGIDKYDGYTLSSFNLKYLQEKDKNFSLLTSADEDKLGNIWFCSQKNGVIVFNIHTNKVQLIDLSDIASNNVQAVLCDSKGRTWLATTRGLVLYNLIEGKTKVYTTSEKKGSIAGNYTICILEDNKENIWVGTWGDGVSKYNEVSDDFTSFNIFKVSEKHKDKKSNRVSFISEDSKGNLWFGARWAGVFVTKYENEQLKVIKRLEHEPEKESSILGNLVYSVTEDHLGRIWMGSPYGINVISNFYSDSAQIKNYIAGGDDNSSLSNIEVMHLMCDDSGIIWTATIGGGINKFDYGKQKFIAYDIPPVDDQIISKTVESFYVNERNELFLGIKSLGFGKYNINNGTFISYKDIAPYNRLPFNINTVKCFLQDSLGQLWLGTRYSGLIRYDKAKDDLEVYRRENTKAFRSRRINSLITDRLNRIWVGTPDNLHVFTPGKNGYVIEKLAKQLSETTDGNRVYITSLLIDKNNHLWVGTADHGLLRSKNSVYNKEHTFEVYTSTSKDVKLKNKNILSIFQDSKDRLWVGVDGSGLYLVNYETESINTFDKTNGFYAEVVNNILEDNNGYLWLGTNRGITKLKINEGGNSTFVNYTKEDGLQGNFFLEGTGYKDFNGNLYFGGHYGFNKIEPDKVNTNEFIPPVEITGVQILDRDVDFAPNQKELVLTHKDIYFSIAFTALSYSSSDKNRFAYMLEGLDNSWRYTQSSNRAANYTNLKAGDYTFKVKASNCNDIWNNTPTTLNVSVKPAPYKTWWAYSIYILTLVAIVLLVFRFVLERVKMQQALKIEQLEREEADKLNQFKLRFFTNISHELLTPLSIISSLIEDDKQRIGNQELSILKRNTKTLVRLIRQLLEFRKVETGSLKLKVRLANFAEYINQLSENFVPLADKKSIHFKVQCSDSLNGWFDIDVIDKIMHNILSNAFKYTPKNGQILLSADTMGDNKNQTLVIEVKDTGIGIPEDKIATVFERFYRYENEGSSEGGTGIGLSYTKTLTELHKGDIGITSKINEGTVVSVKIPFYKEAFQEDEISKEKDKSLAYNQTTEINETDREELSHNNNLDINLEKEYKILIAEDNHDFRSIISSKLNKYFIVKEAENGKVAFEMVQNEDFDLIISDIMMPEMNGLELCRRLKRTFETSHIPVILLTAKTSEVNQIEGYELGADSYLTKPVNLSLLQSRVSSLIATREKLTKVFKDSLEVSGEKKLLSADEEFLMKAKQIVLNNISDPEFTIKDLHDNLGVSNSTLYRKLTSLTSLNPNDFVKHIRLKTAAKFLKDPSVSVSEAMYKTGFKDLSYFGVCFKKEFGVSPSEY